MAQFGSTGKNPPWARATTDFGTAATQGMNQQMMNPGVTSQAVFNLAAQQQQQQTLQSQFQAQQMAAATMQNMQQQQQAMLPQPGIAMPTSLASTNMQGAVSYPTLKAQQAAGQQPKQRVFSGAITKLHDNFGFVDEDVFFQTTCVKGQMPKLGDRVLVEAQYNANMPFKWNATSVKVLNYQANTGVGNNLGSKFSSGIVKGFGNKGFGNNQMSALQQQQSLMDQGANRVRNDRNRSGNRFDRDRQRNRDRRDRDKKTEDKETASSEVSLKRSRSPKKSTSPVSSKKSRSPPRRRPRVVPRYVVQVPKIMLDIPDANVVSLKSRYSNMYVPSDFFHTQFPWHDVFPLLRPFQLGKPCHFHVMHKDVERVGQAAATPDPPDADHLFSAKVMLIACPSLDDLYHKSCSLSQDPENIQENFVHPTRLINFLVGVKGKNEPIAIGGPWSPSLDGPNPAEDPKVLIKTAIRTTKALTGINLSGCTQWYRFAEVHYLRPEETHRGKVVPAHVETTVIFLPDVWSCQPTHLEWETLQLSYKKQLQKKLSQMDGKEDTQEEEDEGDESLGEKKEPTHYSELDPKSMKIVDLKRELECRTLSSKGLKSQLMARLAKVLKTEQEDEQASEASKKDEPEEPVEEEKMDTEEDEEKKKKEEEERKKEEEKRRATLERRYTLPEKPSILVYPNATAKGGKFDCSTMSLSVLLDYRPEDNKEHSFEVSLFAELFNEMLMRDFGFSIYKSLCAAPEKPKEDKKDKKKDKDEKKKDEKDKDSDKKESKDEDKKEVKEEKSDKDKADKDDDKDKKKEKEDKKEKREKRKYMTVKPDLLLSCIYFDQNHCGYLLDRDVEEILHSIGLSLSRAQTKKLVQKVVARDSFHYRKLTDVPVQEEDKQPERPELPVDLDMIAAGNLAMLQSGQSPSKVRGMKPDAAKKEGEPLTGMVMYNGAMLDIDSMLERLNKGEKSLNDLERKMKEVTEERDTTKKELKKRDETITKQTADYKSLKHELSVQEKITNSSESNNRKYLSALMESQTLLGTLVNTVTGALGNMANIKLEKDEDGEKAE